MAVLIKHSHRLERSTHKRLGKGVAQAGASYSGQDQIYSASIRFRNQENVKEEVDEYYAIELDVIECERLLERLLEDKKNNWKLRS